MVEVKNNSIAKMSPTMSPFSNFTGTVVSVQLTCLSVKMLIPTANIWFVICCSCRKSVKVLRRACLVQPEFVLLKFSVNLCTVVQRLTINTPCFWGQALQGVSPLFFYHLLSDQSNFSL